MHSSGRGIAERTDNGARLLDTAASSYAPATLKLLGQAFDEVWQDIAGNYGAAATIEDRRTRLALIILELANMGERDLDDIKREALAIMRLREQRTQSRHWFSRIRLFDWGRDQGGRTAA
jgi:hypothetical protein